MQASLKFVLFVVVGLLAQAGQAQEGWTKTFVAVQSPLRSFDLNYNGMSVAYVTKSLEGHVVNLQNGLETILVERGKKTNLVTAVFRPVRDEQDKSPFQDGLMTLGRGIRYWDADGRFQKKMSETTKGGGVIEKSRDGVHFVQWFPQPPQMTPEMERIQGIYGTALIWTYGGRNGVANLGQKMPAEKGKIPSPVPLQAAAISADGRWMFLAGSSYDSAKAREPGYERTNDRSSAFVVRCTTDDVGGGEQEAIKRRDPKRGGKSFRPFGPLNLSDIGCSSDGNVVAVVTRAGYVLVSRDGDEFQPTLTGFKEGVDREHHLAVSDDGEVVAVTRFGSQIFLLGRQPPAKQLIGHGADITKIRFMGGTLVSTDKDGRVILWDIRQDEPELVLADEGAGEVKNFIISTNTIAVLHEGVGITVLSRTPISTAKTK